jgi:hypothetical protein
MDDVQLRCVLDFRCYEHRHVGTCIINARDRLVLVCSLIYLARNGLRAKCTPHRRQALPAIALGNTIMGIVMVLNGTIGARLHIAFPILNRSSFGFWLSYFSVVSRVVLSLFWFGVQTFIGSESVYQVQLIHLSFFPY